MHLRIAYSKIKKQNLVLINNDTHQRETISERTIRPPLKRAKVRRIFPKTISSNSSFTLTVNNFNFRF